jgi:lactate dehydrogenase-like 2-hydroxyacid dehydrogenase
MGNGNGLPTVLITHTLPDDLLQPLHGLAHVIMGPAGGRLMPRAEVLELAGTLTGIINQGELRVDQDFLARTPQLRIVANVAVGIDNLDTKLMAVQGVWATNAPDAYTEATADCTLGLLLALARRLHVADRFVRAGEWKRSEPGVWDGALLAGKTLGIVGYGRIGQAVAQRARAFGMKVIFNRRHQSNDAAYRPLDQLLAEADVVSLHTPLTPATHHLINATSLEKMKPDAFLVNMARGPVVDEEALVHALQNQRLAGAALDVFEHEPDVHPALITLDNVVLSPHLGGGTYESRLSARTLSIANVVAALTGKRPLTPVNEPFA